MTYPTMEGRVTDLMSLSNSGGEEGGSKSLFITGREDEGSKELIQHWREG